MATGRTPGLEAGTWERELLPQPFDLFGEENINRVFVLNLLQPSSWKVIPKCFLKMSFEIENANPGAHSPAQGWSLAIGSRRHVWVVVLWAK